MPSSPASLLTDREIAAAKARVAQAAVDEICDDMRVGLGTGSTAALAIEAIGRRVADGLRITGVATSLASEMLAIRAGIPVTPFDDLSHVDLAIDGADEIDPQLRAIKGAGGALLREKIVAQAADRMICIVDAGKMVTRLGARPIPIELLPFARTFVLDAIRALGGEPRLRQAGDRPAITDQGNLLADCQFDDLSDPEALASALSAIPGLLGHGLFLTEIDLLLVGGSDGVTRHTRT